MKNPNENRALGPESFGLSRSAIETLRTKSKRRRGGGTKAKRSDRKRR